MEITTRTNLTCPHCGFVEELDIPQDFWLVFHTCPSCSTQIRPKSGDCCVFCSYGDHHCTDKQKQAQVNDILGNEPIMGNDGE